MRVDVARNLPHSIRAAISLFFRRHTMKKIPLILLALLPLAAHAQQQQVNPCINKASTQEMNSCAKAEYEKADERLQQVYKALLKQIPKQDEDGIPYVATEK